MSKRRAVVTQAWLDWAEQHGACELPQVGAPIDQLSYSAVQFVVDELLEDGIFYPDPGCGAESWRTVARRIFREVEIIDA